MKVSGMKNLIFLYVHTFKKSKRFRNEKKNPFTISECNFYATNVEKFTIAEGVYHFI